MPVTHRVPYISALAVRLLLVALCVVPPVVAHAAPDARDLLRAIGAGGAIDVPQDLSSDQDAAARRAAEQGDVEASAARRRQRSEATDAAGEQKKLSPGSVLLLQPYLPESTLSEGDGPSPSGPGGVAPPTSVRERLGRVGVGGPVAERAERVSEGNPYRLDARGELQLPGMRPIQLNGLTEAQATAVIAAHRELADLNIRVMVLPVQDGSPSSLPSFGYDLFDDPNGSFAPSSDIPVPADYVLAPGDALEVTLSGTENRRTTLDVDRDGQVNMSELGSITVAGLRLDEARRVIEERVAERLVGTEVNVSIGALRSIRVFVYGEAKQPGSIVVSGLSTITNALFASGGVSKVGSLRRIQLKRDGVTVAVLDLYDLLLRGDARQDQRLLAGDVIYIPTVGPTVSISGAVRRPATYELSGSEASGATAATLLRLAGGLLPEADPAMSVVERISEARERVVLNVDLRGAGASNFRLTGGDVVHVAAVRSLVSNGISVEGSVYRPGPRGFRRGMRVTDVIRSIDELKPDADVHYVLVRRETGASRTVSVQSVDLAAALDAPRAATNIVLQPRDRVIVLDRSNRSVLGAGTRRRVIDDLLDELRRQSTMANPTRIVSIRGRVNAPGEYPLEPGMRLTDLLRAGGGADDGAYAGAAELSRSGIGQQRDVTLVPVDLGKLVAGNDAENIELQPFDSLLVREMPSWNQNETVRLLGEVRFPGEYQIRRGETLDSVIARAGGLTDLAFLDGSVFTRSELRDREQRQLDGLAERLRRDLAAAALSVRYGAVNGTSNSEQSQSGVGDSLLAQIRSARAVGRLVIDLERALASDARAEERIALRDGDTLVVPRMIQEVTVVGEVQNSTSHLYNPGFTRNDYIRMSGGFGPLAAQDRTYVIRADGSVASSSSSSWFARAGRDEIRPGDSIVVPLDAERTPTLPLVVSVSTILYNIAVAVAAIGNL
jgi:polysaccharide export outer membrane protein